MAYPKQQNVAIKTDGSGDATEFIHALNGKIIHVAYIADGANPYDATLDITITLERSGVVVWSEINVAASKLVRPRQRINNPEGVLQPDLDFIIAGAGPGGQDKEFDRLKIVLAQGGANNDGVFTVLMA